MDDGALLRLAGRQHGLITLSQLTGLGFSEKAIRHRLAVGVLFRVHRAVYAVAGTKDTFEFRVLAAVLAGGSGTLASHRCAAALFGLRRIRCDVPEITVSGRTAPRLAGIRAHRREPLLPADRSRIGLIPVTSPAWTLLDLAAAGMEPGRWHAPPGRPPARRPDRRAAAGEEAVGDGAGGRAAGGLPGFRVAGAGAAVRAAVAGRGNGPVRCGLSGVATCSG